MRGDRALYPSNATRADGTTTGTNAVGLARLYIQDKARNGMFCFRFRTAQSESSKI
ncbi:hypothetical protein SAMN05216386_1571 [Nitrosospira briensis]|uniref:Uncharacterized protein n=1 Tax=Nitrosospira briensis TaxID=35799 RepID=A0A1I5AXS1_9PROT|nr:hypothetical protein SAMN05216386_1571 [Nitrosospira briensis]